MTSRTQLGRRAMLRGMLGGVAVGVGLPMLEIFMNDEGKALADGSNFPKRFGIFFWGNGMIPSRWNPTTTGTGWEMTEQLEPLAALKSRITLVSGMGVKTANTEAHSSGASGIFTGASLLQTPQGTTLAGPSIDQLIAASIGGTTRFRSIETSCESNGSWSYRGPHNRNPAESSPRALFDRIFGDGFREPGEVVAVDPRLRQRRSVLTAVQEDALRLRRRLGSADRLRLDQHLAGVRALEAQIERLEAAPPNLEACARPDMPLDAYPPIEGRAQLSAINRAITDIMVMALACDQTRVFSHWFTQSVSNVLFPLASDGFHQLTHDEPGDQPQVNEIVKLIMEEFAYLVSRLDAIEEGDGETLLDHMTILCTSDCSLGRQHRLEEFPIILAGGASGRLRMGTHYRSPSTENTSHVLYSLATAMGLSLASFGEGNGRVTSGLPAIEL